MTLKSALGLLNDTLISVTQLNVVALSVDTGQSYWLIPSFSTTIGDKILGIKGAPYANMIRDQGEMCWTGKCRKLGSPFEGKVP